MLHISFLFLYLIPANRTQRKIVHSEYESRRYGLLLSGILDKIHILPYANHHALCFKLIAHCPSIRLPASAFPIPTSNFQLPRLALLGILSMDALHNVLAGDHTAAPLQRLQGGIADHIHDGTAGQDIIAGHAGQVQRLFQLGFG